MDGESVVYLLYLIGPAIAGVSLYWIVIRAPGRRLASDFATLGTLKGRTLNKIIRVAGPPTSASTRADGSQLLQWTARGYNMELLFDANRICQGEYNESPPTPSVARTEPAPTQPKIANISNASVPITVEEARKIIADHTTIAKTTDLKAPTALAVQAATVQTVLAQTPVIQTPTVPNLPAISPPLQSPPLQNPPLQTPVAQIPVIQAPTVQNLPVQKLPLQNLPIQSPVVQTPVAEAPTVPNIPAITPPLQSPPLQSPHLQGPLEEPQMASCTSCGSSLSSNAKFCDTCGDAVTQPTSEPKKETQIVPLSNLQETIEPLSSTVTVTWRVQTASVSCENCGRELQYGDKFCDRCGAST